MIGTGKRGILQSLVSLAVIMIMRYARVYYLGDHPKSLKVGVLTNALGIMNKPNHRKSNWMVTKLS